VFVSSLLGDHSLNQSLEGLREAAGFLRRELGKGLKLRTVPQLHFAADESIERGVRMGALIDDALAADAELMGSTVEEALPSSAESFDIRAIPGARS
jgi:ribosome-binding factor A